MYKSNGVHKKQIEKDAKEFLHKYTHQWNDNIASIAVSSLERQKFENPQILPITEDIVRLGNWVDQQIESLTTELHGDPQSSEAYRALTEAVFVKTELLNYRRSGEIEAILVENFLRRKYSKDNINKEVFDSLTDIEKNMVKR